MADKKMTKKASEATEGIKTIEQLREELVAKRSELHEAERSHAAGELVNPRVLTTTRKEIARLLTAIRAAELDPSNQVSQEPQTAKKESK